MGMGAGRLGQAGPLELHTNSFAGRGRAWAERLLYFVALHVPSFQGNHGHLCSI